MSVRVSEITVANPATSFTQDEMLALLGLAEDRFARGIFARCGVSTRHLEVTPTLLATTLQERTVQTEEQLLRLAIAAVDELGVDPAEVGTLITATYYSLGGPTLAHRLLEHYAMDPATDKYHLVGVGCASAVPLFRLAAQSLRDHPGKRALVVAAESISGFVTPASPDDERTKKVGSALFGDGCAAVLLGDGEADPLTGPTIVATQVHQLGGTLDTVHFRLTGTDSFMQIGTELPRLAKARLSELVDAFLAGHDVARADLAHWVVHPGGRGIIDGVQEGLDLTEEQVAVSRDVLDRFGNMGTPSSLYVLRETIAQRTPAPGELGLMVTIGPGVTVGLMLLRW